ncbi:hypothetical protein sscle_06g054910 [Sclerotinia sclerotiorum 1980 UF-70]|uniref:Uncharacterized protein n=1 Tax=Sclerotinia sclerotiorum (strain ATCC 18683 / 1980 / Ss-1) TaxID=665079 RepID=A0A1D9Q715_SCLS1|nr:hypothetical protein sscle_06g054910 [Sclerotinia sclerotiorum 1980 UF-70]
MWARTSSIYHRYTSQDATISGKVVHDCSILQRSQTWTKNKIQRLLKRGVESDLLNPRKVTPLCIAATNGHMEVIRLFLETKSVNVNVTCVSGRSLIFYAAANGHEEIVKLLLNAEADPTFIDTEGETALLVSKRYGYYRIVDILSAWK